MNNSNHNLEEERFGELLASLDADAPEVDESVRDRLEVESARAFAERFSQKTVSRETPLQRRNSRMFVIAMRSLAAAAATALFAFGLFSLDSESGAPTLAAVLENIATADSLHMEITTDGKADQVWVQKPGRMRWDSADGEYLIARGGRMWDIDEKANRATSSKDAYFEGEKKQLDVLAMLNLPKGERSKKLLEAKPTETVSRGTRQFSVYRANLMVAEGDISVEARVEFGTHRLSSLRVRPIGKTPRPAVALNILAANKPVDESLFVVGDTLTEDGRIGKVADVQGIVAVRPVMQKRWSPLVGHMLLKPGDWVRTDVRGANAVALRLMKQTSITLGPGSLVELVSPRQIKIISGVLKITVDPKSPVELIGPGDENVTVKKTTIVRLQDDKLVHVDESPKWLTGFEGTTTNESLGSLLAKVDGRDVPLTVGYHRVKVDIRDQIARTVIEESFVNHTDSRTEGVFYFPLPQDTSISGFAMWIGGEKVTADIVEKQRAREIYEIILSERRDPGLLEWSGGNIFKARVFPIEPHSEKRIEISYTQVLPLRGNKYRYSYALRSELLQQNPLRDLRLDVTLYSAQPLAGVTSPTHTTRIEQTKNSANVEFAAQEYTPTRDFEVVVELDDAAPEVVMIPHQRGDDGYFLLQLKPPSDENAWQRDVVQDTGPIDLLILADTSASMDKASRTTQAEFIASLLGSLTPDDKVNLAVCDVTCEWTFKRATAANETNIEKARQILDDRVSLGWTDLDKTFASALKQCGPNTRVVYVGDGIVTGTDSDPTAFGKRLRKQYEGHSATFHAVSTSSSFEPQILKTIGRLGGGSTLAISGERGPQAVALELLGEITRPAIRDLKVEFKGLRPARVYPEELPNLAPGTQQILLGRYLPEGKDQTGQVIVTGMLNDKPVKFTVDVSLKEAEDGNSFIPRLWARMHLDVLLEQGTSQSIRDEIIRLSEEYHIMTPYTSLLVLETDADRERFKVKRRFEMSDGQRFFAEGHDNANYELVQQQMRRAGNWRIGLRRQVLSQLIGLGRDANVFAQPWSDGFEIGEITASSAISNESAPVDSVWGGGFGSYKYHLGGLGYDGRMAGMDGRGKMLFTNGSMPGGTISVNGKWNRDFNGDGLLSLDFADGESLIAGSGSDVWFERGARENRLADLEGNEYFGPQAIVDGKDLSSEAFDFDAAFITGDKISELGSLMDATESISRSPSPSNASSILGLGLSFAKNRERYLGKDLFYAGRRYQSQSTSHWIDGLFPGLPGVPAQYKAPKDFKPWSAEARRLAESLLRTKQMASLKGGLIIERNTKVFDTRWGNLTSRSEVLELVSPKAWLTRTGRAGSQTTIQWCDTKSRNILSDGFQLARTRKSEPRDLSQPPLSLIGKVVTSLERTYWSYDVSIKKTMAGRSTGDNQPISILILKHPTNKDYELHYHIDTKRNVLVRSETRQKGKVTSSAVFSDFVEVAGAWWVTRVDHFDKDENRTSLATQKFRQIDTEEFGRRIDRQLAGLDKVQFLSMPLPKLGDAKKARDEGKATFEDQVVLMLHFAASQQWDRVVEHFEAAETLAADKPGMFWVRNAMLNLSRRREELRQRILTRAEALAGPRIAGQLPVNEYFLAEHLRSQASGILQVNEMLELLATLKPIYHRQPKHLMAKKAWQKQQMNFLRSSGQQEAALVLQRELAEQYPHDYSLQQQYAQALVNARRFDAAKAWLDGVLVEEAKWLTGEEESMRNTYTQMLRSRGDYPALVDYLAAWTEENPSSGSAYQHYLSALVRADREDEANGLIEKWLANGRTTDELSSADAQRLYAASRQAMGQGYNLNTNRLDERWIEPLAEIVLFVARLDETPQSMHVTVTSQIMGNRRFTQTDQCRRVQREVAKLLVARIDTLPVERVQRWLDWISPNDPVVEKDVWQRLADSLLKRWEAEEDVNKKHQLAQPLIQVLSGRLGTTQYLAFLRRQVEEGPEKFRTHYVGQLFNALLNQPWSADYENEAFALLEQLSDAEQPIQRLTTHIQALHRLTDNMVQRRYQARMAEIEHPEKLKRPEENEEQTENLRLAREGFADRLVEEMKRPSEAETFAQLAQWMNIERLYLDVLAGRKLDRVTEECWELLGPKPQPIPEKVTVDDVLDDVLRTRYLVTLANLAARKDADKALTGRLLAYCDEGIAIKRQQSQWKMAKYQLLVALDRAKELETHLRDWIRPDQPDSHWRLTLAYLLAERGKVAEAIKHFELIETADELGPTEYRVLSDWYMVVDRRADHDRAKIGMYQTMQEHQMTNWLAQQIRPWQQSQGQLPDELNTDVLLVFQALFHKSSSPQGHLYRLREFYRATRDFRLPKGLPDAVIGHTAGRVYPFLKNMGTVLSEIREEATVQEIVGRIVEVRQDAKTTIDLRALDLLELLIERRAAELQNQPGPHAENALAAMQGAFKREWSSGEPRLMADFLLNLGTITDTKLAEEQIRELTVLHREAKPGTIDRLHIAHCLAKTHWNYGRQTLAIDLLEAALGEFQESHDDILPATANGVLTSFVAFLNQTTHHARSETVLLGHRKQNRYPQQDYWLTQQLYTTYEDAIRRDGHVSLGTGKELFDALEDLVRGDLDTADHDHRYELVIRLCGIYRAAHSKNLSGAADAMLDFATNQLPEVLKRQTNNYQSMVSIVGANLHDVAGVRDGLAFLIARIEEEPTWFRLNNDNGWRRHGSSLASWRTKVKELGDIEGRLLALVVDELQRDLRTRQSHNRQMYHDDHSYFWKEKADAFAQAAEEVLAEQKTSGAAVQYIASYLYHGLNRSSRAIEILFVAHDAGLLDEGGHSTLVSYLQARNRYGESIAVLEALMKRSPANIDYRCRLMHAYFRTARRDQLLALFEKTDKYFHEGERWNEHAMSNLAKSCLDNQLFKQSVAYCKELIPLHEKTAPNQGIGNGTLSTYYTHLANAYSGLKKTDEAVEAAGAAIVSWGPTHTNRRHAVATLVNVLKGAPDLDAYVGRLDKEAAKTKQYNPIIRNAIGQAYLAKGQFARAIVQLELAVELQPNDKETHQVLVSCYDQQGDRQGAIEQRLASLQLSRRDIALYEDLGNRLKALERDDQMERAYTSIVEMLPNESESHAKLAEIRQNQKRWDDAVAHWHKVIRIRTLEPGGLIGLAGAQIGQKQWDAASETIEKLEKTGWPSRFDQIIGSARSDLERRIEIGHREHN